MGGRFGWRLPTTEELSSLMVPSTVECLGLPAGHPFTVDPFFHWSATVSPDEPTKAIGVHFNLGLVTPFLKTDSESSGAQAWCVRGGRGS